MDVTPSWADEDPFDPGPAPGPTQADIDLEFLYHRAEREGMRLDSLLCPECPDPGLCGAEGECPRGGA